MALSQDGVICLVLFIISLVALVSNKVSMEGIGIGCCLTLAWSGILTTTQSFAGFSDPLNIMIACTYVIGEGLSSSGLSARCGHLLISLCGKNEMKLQLATFFLTSIISFVMSNTGAVCVAMPIVIAACQSTGRNVSKYLMQVAFAAAIGGTFALISTPPNLTVSEYRKKNTGSDFGFFDFSPLTLLFMAFSCPLLVTVVYKNLPDHHTMDVSKMQDMMNEQEHGGSDDKKKESNVKLINNKDSTHEMTVLPSPAPSPVAAVAASSSASSTSSSSSSDQHDIATIDSHSIPIDASTNLTTDLNTNSSPSPDPSAEASDSAIASTALPPLPPADGLYKFRLPPTSSLIGQRIDQLKWRAKYHFNIVAIERPIPGTYTPPVHIDTTSHAVDDSVVPSSTSTSTEPTNRSRTNSDSSNSTFITPKPSTFLSADDIVWVQATAGDMKVFIEKEGTSVIIISNPTGVTAIPSPFCFAQLLVSLHSTWCGQTTKELAFERTYDVTIISIRSVSSGKCVPKSQLGIYAIEPGDIITVICNEDVLYRLYDMSYTSHGTLHDYILLSSNPEMNWRTVSLRYMKKLSKTPHFLLNLPATTYHQLVALCVLIGLIPLLSVEIPNVSQTTIMVSACVVLVWSGALKANRVWTSISWSTITLTAGMTAMATALQKTGVITEMVNGITSLFSGASPWVFLGVISVITFIVTQFMSNTACAILIAPLAGGLAKSLNVSMDPFLMACSFFSSAAFLTPVGSPTNLLVQVPGGYTFKDYFVAGLPISIVGLVLGIAYIPLQFPF